VFDSQPGVPRKLFHDLKVTVFLNISQCSLVCVGRRFRRNISLSLLPTARLTSHIFSHSLPYDAYFQLFLHPAQLFRSRLTYHSDDGGSKIL
jgi:hypothetical protein